MLILGIKSMVEASVDMLVAVHSFPYHQCAVPEELNPSPSSIVRRLIMHAFHAHRTVQKMTASYSSTRAQYNNA